MLLKTGCVERPAEKLGSEFMLFIRLRHRVTLPLPAEILRKQAGCGVEPGLGAGEGRGLELELVALVGRVVLLILEQLDLNGNVARPPHESTYVVSASQPKGIETGRGRCKLR